HNIEKLIRSSQLHVCADHHRVPSLHDRILKLVQENRQPFGHSDLEIVALEHLLKRHPAIQLDDLKEGHFFEPFAVKYDLRSARIKDLKSLSFVGFGVGFDLVAGQHGPG